MRDLTSRALDTATALGASYADVRVVRRVEESITIKTGRLEGVAGGETEGFGVRVLVDGAWGFSASHHLSPAEADRVAADAVRIAKASATALRTPVRLDDRPPAHGRYETPVTEDPFAVPLDRKIADLMAADEALRRVDGIAWTETIFGAQRAGIVGILLVLAAGLVALWPVHPPWHASATSAADTADTADTDLA